ncbi:hypothetical protein HYPSUDRAFT_44621 [Hypholoma sublateritium FD-334 SS-4]|uniref:Uncharacterized protein n=1 Tax=Hypholoma sublateritium (strain FD-334 SS-4) TaxID=945553 RepID=A0A0D2M7F9_HYPSF|nr:hypothetical protein HYPSUDRAFT_44621 [Hypholoma sublateritium FD-334 SS-4]
MDAAITLRLWERANVQQDPKHFFPGNYDLYVMELPFMNGVYSPKTGPVNPEALYKTILKYQAKKDRTAKITIPEGYDTFGKDGSFKSGIFCDPMEDMPFNVSLSSFQVAQKTSFRSEYSRPADSWEGPSIQGRLEVIDGGCGIASSSGTLTMQPLWKKRDADGELMELFEGTFNFRVSYSGMYSRKGHGSGQKQTIPFWGVRAAE